MEAMPSLRHILSKNHYKEYPIMIIVTNRLNRLNKQLYYVADKIYKLSLMQKNTISLQKFP